MLTEKNKFTRLYALLLQGVFIVSLFFFGCEKPVQPIRIQGETMGTTYSIQYFLSESANPQNLQIDIDSILTEINRQMSTFITNSDISRFNRWHGKGVFKISNHFRKVVERSLAWHTITEGFFDISILPLVSIWGFGPDRWNRTEEWKPPTQTDIDNALETIGSEKLSLSFSGLSKLLPDTQIDLSAIAKGYAVDQISEYLKQKKIANFLVEIGGEVRCRGLKPDAASWKIGIDHPDSESGERSILGKYVHLLNRSMGTSGNYRNFHTYKGKNYSHELDPRTGYPIENRVASVSVFTKKCMDADALATALIVMGFEDGSTLLESLSGYEAIWVLETEDGFVIRSSEGLNLGEDQIYAVGASG